MLSKKGQNDKYCINQKKNPKISCSQDTLYYISKHIMFSTQAHETVVMAEN